MSSSVLPSYTRTVNDQFPTICAKCLGSDSSSQYLSMIRSTMGSECKLCNRVYTSYKFKQAKNASRYVHTEICKTCSTMRNICQCCLLDLDFSVPFWMRDSVESEQIEDQNIIGHQNELMAMIHAEQVQNVLDGKSRTEAIDMIGREQLLSKLKKPFAKEFTSGFKAPEDKRIKTLYVGQFDSMKDGIEEEDLRKNFEPYGPLRHIKMRPDQKCALVTYLNREDAELAAEALYGGILKINNVKVNVQFVKKKAKKEKEQEDDDAMEDVQEQTTRFVPPPLDPRILAVMSLPEKVRPPLPEELPMLIPPHVFDDIPPPPSDQDDYVYPSQRVEDLRLL